MKTSCDGGVKINDLGSQGYVDDSKQKYESGQYRASNEKRMLEMQI